ncbi:TPA: FliC/FljB family flagellin [Kluyvera ascorbata]|nr:FliC/FljB family flagellin [Kluyvera ascorbata]
MAQVINTNSLSLITQNNINKNQSALSSSIERLSSGLRINSAKDDAAGQAIANRFTSNIKGLTQAARNANDGISVAQTTEGALSEINNNLQRIRELTVQSQNGTNSDSDLSSIQKEINSRLDEIDRVSNQTQFNGVNVLAKDGTMKIQVGANDGQTISINLKQINSQTLNLKGFNVGTTEIANGATTSVAYTLKDTGATTESSIKGYAKGSDGNTYVTDGSDYYKATSDDTTGLLSYDSTATAVTGVKFSEIDAPARNLKVDTSGLDSNQALVQYRDANGKDAYAVQTTATDGTKSYVSASFDKDGKVTASTTNVDVLTGDPLKALDAAIATVDNFRSDLGAIQNRLDSAVTNLNNTTTNLSEAQSRIQDADYATEVSNMSKAQIIQQAGNSVLAKANQVPQQVLSLLQG